MKLNFWQWIGVVLLVVGIVWWWSGAHKTATQIVPPGNAATQPTTAP